MMFELRLEHVAKTFAPAILALDDVSLTVRPGECLALVGPSGCGKTTLLRLVAGLELPTSGDLYFGRQRVNHVPGHQREVAMMFQRPALLANKTVRQNIRWGRSLRQSWVGMMFPRSGNDCEQEVAALAQKLGLQDDLDRPAGQLSGGQQQRVALARCLYLHAKIWLLDEPLGHLDAPLRRDLRRQIRALAQERGAILLFVTHDPNEALAIGDDVAVMQQGRIVQRGTPYQISRFPHDRFVADLLHHDHGAMNYLEGQFGGQAGCYWFEGPLGQWRFPPWAFADDPNHLKRDQGICKETNVSEILGRMDSPFRANFLQAAKILLSKNNTIHIILGIAAEHLSCSADKSSQGDLIQMTISVARQEFSTGQTWVVGHDERGRQWIGRLHGEQHLRSGQVVTMKFSIQQTYGFEHTTGQTLWAPIG